MERRMGTKGEGNKLSFSTYQRREGTKGSTFFPSGVSAFAGASDQRSRGRWGGMEDIRGLSFAHIHMTNKQATIHGGNGELGGDSEDAV
jgi:hypothetical protein